MVVTLPDLLQVPSKQHPAAPMYSHEPYPQHLAVQYFVFQYMHVPYRYVQAMNCHHDMSETAVKIKTGCNVLGLPTQ